MARNVSRQSAALATARARRRELDRERDSQDLRVEEATAAALVMLQLRGEAQTALEVASAALGTFAADAARTGRQRRPGGGAAGARPHRSTTLNQAGGPRQRQAGAIADLGSQFQARCGRVGCEGVGGAGP